MGQILRISARKHGLARGDVGRDSPSTSWMACGNRSSVASEIARAPPPTASLCSRHVICSFSLVLLLCILYKPTTKRTVSTGDPTYLVDAMHPFPRPMKRADREGRSCDSLIRPTQSRITHRSFRFLRARTSQKEKLVQEMFELIVSKDGRDAKRRLPTCTSYDWVLA